MNFITLNTKDKVLIDKENYGYFNQWKWHLDTNGYARRTQRIGPRKENKSIVIIMHREIMKAKKGQEVDHINGNRLDNRKENLRIASDLENARNVKKRNNCSSKYKGVSWHKCTKKWQSRIGLNRTKIHLGLFNSEKEAALAYNKIAKELFGEFAKLNEIPKTT